MINSTHPTHIYTLSLHDALPISRGISCLHTASQAKSVTASSNSGGISGTSPMGQIAPCATTCNFCHLNVADETINTPFSTDRKSTRLNSSHSQISYAVFCLKQKT